MSPSLRTVLLGSSRNGPRRSVHLLVPPLLFVGVLIAYGSGVVAISGGVVFLPTAAAVVGVVAAAGLAVRRAGLAVAWASVSAALLGHGADHYLLGLSGRSLGERLVAFLGVDGLVVVGIQAVALGTLAWVGGRLVARGVAVVRGRARESSTGVR